MKRILLLGGIFYFLVICSYAQIAKKTPSKVITVENHQTNSFNPGNLPDRTKLKRLSNDEYNFSEKQKVEIDNVKHWYAIENRGNETYWKNVECNKLIVEFKKGYTLDNIQIKEYLIKNSLSKVLEKSMFPEIQNFFVFEVPNGRKSQILDIVQDSRNYDFILSAEPSPIFHLNTCEPNDPYYLSYQWGPYVMYADSVWCYFTGGSNNWIAVIDQSCDWYHEDLYNSVWYGYDFAMNDNDPSPDNDQQKHGTHVSGTIGASINNGTGVAGILNDTIYFAKVGMTDNYPSETGIYNALNSFATQPKIRVINMSFGISTPNSTFETALLNAFDNGKLLIASSGNDGNDVLNYPAAYSFVISVAAVGVDNNGNLSHPSYSNYGTTIDVSAPGGEAATGYPIWSTLPSNNYGGASWQGTSMAAPHVTGVAGLVFAINPLLTNTEARAIIEQQVFDLGATGWDQYFGSGMSCAICAFEEACNQLSITISADGPTTFCSGGQVTLEALDNSQLSYQWLKNGNNINNATSNTYNASESGTYELQIQTLGGVCIAYSNAILVNEETMPANAGTITGAANVCQGQTVIYNVPAISNATSYVWTLPNGATGSSTTNSISVFYSSSAVSGSISVSGNNSCGNGNSSSLAITVNVLPDVAGAISGSNVVCQNQNSVSYSVSPINNALSYIWTLPSGATGSSSTNSIIVNYGSSAISGNIIVVGNNSCGNGSSSSLYITVNQTPATPTISLSGYVLTSSSPTGNQWYNANGTINGATSQQYTVTTTGDYHVVVTANTCSSVPSNTIHVVVTDVEELSESNKIKVYPNPVSSELNIETMDDVRICNFEIINAMGVSVYKSAFNKKTVIQTTDFMPGIYLIRFEMNNSFLLKKFIKK
jgi:subtilisin family serine protease